MSINATCAITNLRLCNLFQSQLSRSAHFAKVRSANFITMLELYLKEVASTKQIQGHPQRQHPLLQQNQIQRLNLRARLKKRRHLNQKPDLTSKSNRLI